MVQIKSEYMKRYALDIIQCGTLDALMPFICCHCRFVFCVIKILKDENTKCEVNTKRNMTLIAIAAKTLNDAKLLEMQQKTASYSSRGGNVFCDDLIILFGAL